MSNTSGNHSSTPGQEPMLSVAQAQQRIREAIRPADNSEPCTLWDAYQRIVASDVISPVNVPPYANSAMDGYALNAKDIPESGSATLQLVGKSFAGNPFDGKVQSGQAVRIMTGAVIPSGADTVIMQEKVEREGDFITIQAGYKAGENVRHIGEDIGLGGTVIAAGKRIEAAEMGLLASLGIAEVPVRKKLRVATFSTGDELCSIGEIPSEGQIFDSNRYSLAGMLRALNVEHIDMGVVRDDPAAISETFHHAATTSDVVISSGGVSVGDADYVKNILDKLGKVDFWKIRMKPGKPLAFGQLGNAVFFGLPGNPVSVMATFYEVVQPALRFMQGEEIGAPLQLRVKCMDRLKSPARMDFQRGVLEYDESGELVVKSTGDQGSHILSSMSRANCFIVVDDACRVVEPGELVEVQPFHGLF